MSPIILAPIGYPDKTLIKKVNHAGFIYPIIPRPVRKLAHIKKGISAGITSVAHNDIPFLAEYKDMDGNITINMQHEHVTNAAIMNFFLPELKISMVYFIHKPWIYVLSDI